ncbi:MAG: hypothetical protein ABI262_24930 [Microcoleus sp.]|jgi:hypothetical protein
MLIVLINLWRNSCGKVCNLFGKLFVRLDLIGEETQHGETNWLREDLGWSSEFNENCFFWNSQESARAVVREMSTQLVIDESLFNVVIVSWHD